MKGDLGDDRIRLSLKVDKLQYLNHIPLEKISQIYIVLTEETIRNLTKKAESTPPLSPLRKGGKEEVEIYPPMKQFPTFKKTMKLLINYRM